MTDPGLPGDLASLEPLEPLDTVGMAVAPGVPDDAALQVMRSGLPAPAFNPFCRDKSLYKFLFAGVVMFVGCLMPFSADYAQVGYKTMSGGLYMLIAIAMIWTWWAAIHNNRTTGASLKWLLFCAFPLIAGIMILVGFDPAQALAAAKAHGILPANAESSTWGTLFDDLFTAGRPSEDAPAAAARAETFWRLLGPGRLFVMLGGLIAELGFFGGILGGAKKNKQDKQAKQMAASERKRK